MNLTEVLESILFGETIEDKLSKIDVKSFDLTQAKSAIKLPGRSSKLQFSAKKLKFPKSFENVENRARAIHFFANHELLAIELMAKALLEIKPLESISENEKIQRVLLSTIRDEQKHLKLYISKLNDWGFEFGDFPLNDFFWKHFQSCDTYSKYFSLMSLTFEAANLDFSTIYQGKFKEIEDIESSNIMNIVLIDEIKHVQVGATYLNNWKKDKTLFNYYIENLPNLITPARSKGPIFYPDPRVKAGLDESFIESVKTYQDDYRITQRKQWKS